MLSLVLIFSFLFVALVSGGAWNVPFQALISVLVSLALFSEGIYFLIGKRSEEYSAAVNLTIEKKHTFKYLDAASFAAFFIFTIYLFVLAYISGGKSVFGYYEAVNWATYGAVYLVALGLSAKRKDFVFKSVLRLGAFAAAFFLIQKFFTVQGASDYTTWGFLPKKNVFNSIVLSSVLIFWGGNVADGQLKKLNHDWLYFTVAIIAALLTATVSNFLGFLAASALLIFGTGLRGKSESLLPSEKRKYARVALLFIIIVCAAVLALKLSEANVGDRLVWYKAGLRMFRAHPFTGVGAGNFGVMLPEFLSESSGRLRSLYAHSFYLEILSETGIIGFSLLAALLYFVIKKSADIRARAVAIFFLVAGATDFIFSFPIIPIIFFALQGAGAPTGLPSLLLAKDKKRKIVFRASVFLAMSYAFVLLVAGLFKYSLWQKEYAKETAERCEVVLSDRK